ncbi:hypothetical protein [Silvimonas iriomotensis]|uniref:Uncharacterized protein n=1 Tax=Silvimonas iriomotensis TaxID=449662 RepID=A0ABQ2PF07_9NEIS|nr:hypothetical protein [Silvimonas iriomotensis]GGP23966.1 hypothetical protein GCM10010970_39660 [Silvimonas iriomotensis]
MHKAILLFLGIVVAAVSSAEDAKFTSAEELQQKNPQEYAEAVAAYSTAQAAQPADTTPLGWTYTYYSGITVSQWNTNYFSPTFNGIPSQGDPAKNITSLSYVAAPSYPLPGGFAPAISLLVYNSLGSLIGVISPLGANGYLTVASGRVPANVPSNSQFVFRVNQSGGGTPTIQGAYNMGNQTLSVNY